MQNTTTSGNTKTMGSISELLDNLLSTKSKIEEPKKKKKEEPNKHKEMLLMSWKDIQSKRLDGKQQ